MKWIGRIETVFHEAVYDARFSVVGCDKRNSKYGVELKPTSQKDIQDTYKNGQQDNFIHPLDLSQAVESEYI